MLVIGLIIAHNTQIYDIRRFGQVEYLCSNPIMVSHDIPPETRTLEHQGDYQALHATFLWLV
jgi:hypothetical protein